MIARILLDVIQNILETLQAKDIAIMFMGGIATSLWAEPRATYDIDGVIEISFDDLEEFFNEVGKKGFTYDKRQPVKSIQGLPFFTLTYPARGHEIYLDLFMARSRYTKEALSRRRTITFEGIKIPIIAPEDLILYKLISGRSKDLDDVREILWTQKRKLDMKYMKGGHGGRWCRKQKNI
ncbi:MAG: nucleotidyltransferase [bacterium]